MDCGLYINAESIRNNWEYGTIIYYFYVDGEKYYSYCEPTTSKLPHELKIYPNPPGYAMQYAILHTHAAVMDVNYFSPSDNKGLNEDEVVGYLVTPGGLLIKRENYKSGEFIADDPGIISYFMPCNPTDIIVKERTAQEQEAYERGIVNLRWTLRYNSMMTKAAALQSIVGENWYSVDWSLYNLESICKSHYGMMPAWFKTKP